MSATRLPDEFCWTRFGPEAGESFDHILQRKDQERESNGGTFFWGIGNSVAEGVAELLRQCECPEVLFSPIRSRPRRVDVIPAGVVTWTACEGLDGRKLELPPSVRVTSRKKPANRAEHYALVCSSSSALCLGDHGRLHPAALRNLRSGRIVGASQVTAVVRREDEEPADEGGYLVALRVSLVYPYFVRLRDPVLSESPSPAS